MKITLDIRNYINCIVVEIDGKNLLTYIYKFPNPLLKN